jgi:CRISPR/Cas system-associated exonuclease Cas4 (RecB family)
MTKFLSPTSINTYLRCPRKYYLKYIKGLKEKPSIHLIRGKAVHDAIAKIHKSEIQDTKDFERTKIELLSLFNHSWIAQDRQIGDLGLPEEALNDYYNESTEMLRGWLKRNPPSLQNRNLRPQAEVKLFSQNHRVMGVIDAIHSVNGKVSLTDYKTGKIDILSQDIKVQMSIYALLYRENFGTLPDQIILDFLKFQQAKPFPVTDDFVQYAERICKKIHGKTSSVDEKDYPCKCHGWCAKDFQ